MPTADTLLEDVTFLTARRAYEFRVDDLRLSALCTKPVEDRLQELFHFRSSIMASPMAMFGDVPATYPPGYVFDLGFWMSPIGLLVPIRFIHFEQRRIVIDVAGESDAITPIYELMCTAIRELQLADGAEIVGEPEVVYDYTEITARCGFSLLSMLGPNPLELMQRAGRTNRNAQDSAVPSIVLQMLPANEEYKGASPGSSPHSFTLSVRAGTKPEDRIYFSGAPVDTDAHVAYLKELAIALTATR